MIWDKEVKYTAVEKEDLERTRDMFANTAMGEMLRVHYQSVYQDSNDIIEAINNIITESFEIADVMIKEKQRRRNICNVDEGKGEGGSNP